MCALFRNRYIIGTKRCRGYDYSMSGKYFITICTKNKIPYFGNIENGKIGLSDIGIIARNLWIEISDHFQNIELDEFIIMPDHINGIISIKTKPGNEKTRISPKPGSLGAIAGSYKSAVSKIVHQFDPGFKWQSRYYDHIISSNSELLRIRKYIRENPVKWKNNNSK